MWVVLAFSCLISITLSQIIVKLPNGQIKGAEYKTYDGRAYLAYRGIPFAEPPVGKLRFQPPQPAKNWSGVMTLPNSTSICYQMNSNSDKENEDCLYINVYTPVLNAITNKTKLPVMFAIHGGGFRDGSAGVNPNYWVQNDVAVASAEYRMGSFGFLSTGDMVLPGNAGLKDQLFALEWIHTNINLFGGDNSRITLQGQSAGGSSVGFLILAPKAKGLFRAAIAESGSPLNSSTYQSKPMNYVVRLAEQIKPSLSKNLSAAEYLAYLQSVPARSVDTATFELAETEERPIAFAEPKHDGAFITQSMYVAFENDMTSLQLGAKRRDDDPADCLPTDNNYQLKKGVNASTAGKFIHDVYAGKNGHLSNHLGKYVKWYSGNWISRSVIKQGQLMAKYNPVYFYQFSYKGPTGEKINNKTVPEADTVGHGEETAYLSQNHNTMTKEDALTYNRLLNMWLTFIKELNPTPQKLELLENIIWPKVSLNNYEYLNINYTLTIEKQPKGEYFLGWQSMFDNYMEEPFTTY